MGVGRAAVLGVVQGVTEFLPVSSSAHLEVVPWLLGWDDLLADREAKKTLDVALHVGSLAGVVVAAGRLRPSVRVLLSVAAASTPAAIAGGLGRNAVTRRLGRPAHVAVIGAVAGAALWWADRRATQRGADRRLESLTGRDVAVVGLAQALALVPGVSRCGATYTAARLRGLAADDAAAYSLLLALPVVAGAGLLAAVTNGREALRDGGVAVAVGAGTAALTGAAAALGASQVTARAAGRLSAYRVGLGGLVLMTTRRRRRTHA